MQLQELVLCATVPSPTHGTGYIALHDINTGTPLLTFKQTNTELHCTSYVTTKNGLGGVILAAQSDKPLLNVFGFQKDQLVSKIILPEKLCCIVVDSRGEYCAGGTASGRLYLWQITSGILFNSFEAHYRRLSVLRFTHDGAALVSASDDSGVHVWSMSRLLDEDLQNDIPTPYCTFSEHTLPVTDIICGVGAFPSCRILTSSTDHTVKLWDLATRSMLTSFLFPQPIISLAMEPSERIFFAAAQDSSIYQVNLFRRKKNGASESVGGGGTSDVVRLEDDEHTKERVIKGDHPAMSMSHSMTGAMLVVGTSSGQIHIYDVASHQLLRSISTYKDKGLSVMSVFTLLKPPDLFGHVGMGEGSAFAREADPMRVVSPFQKTKDPSNRDSQEVPIILPETDSASVMPLPSQEEILEEHRYFVQETAAGGASGVSLRSRVADLEVEVEKLREQLGAAKGLNDSMWENIVQRVLVRNGQVDDEEDAQRNKKRSRSTK